MIKKIIFISILLFVLVISAVFYNYQKAQKAIRETRPSVITTDLVSYPETILAGKVGTFFWNIETPSDLLASTTSIVWSNQSSPSALTFQDSPESVGYPNSTNDYLSGQFKLPDTFDSQITFDKPGKIYFRSFAKVGNLYLWSKEYSLTVLPDK